MESYGNMVQEVQRSMNSLIFGGVLERFPNLRLVSAESDVGWIPHFMYRLDHGYNKYWANAGIRKLKMAPSDYIRRQVYATFQDDPIGPATWSFFGEDNYMWASDFPHGDCTWPNSRKVIASEFAANSVLHSASRDGGAFTLRAEIRPGRLRIEVEDAGGLWRDGPRDDTRFFMILGAKY